MKTKLLLIATLLILSQGFSQQNPWKVKTSKKGITILPEKQNLPSTQLYDLDLRFLQKGLKASPVRGKSSSSSVIMSFPNADGTMENFRVYEASILHPDLAAKYPDIKSYAGQGIENPSSIIRFSISSNGLSSMRLSADDGAVFIEPYSADGKTYTIYKRDEKPTPPEKFRCLAEQKSAELPNTSGLKNNADDGILRTYRLAVSTTGEYTQYHGGTVAQALAAINTTMTRVNGIFETDFGVTMVLIPNNDEVIYTNPSTDPYTTSYNSQLQNTLTNIIGEANYDIGHLFVRAGNNGNAGCIGCVCINGQKGSAFTSGTVPEGDLFDVDYVAHEMGHQFGANHTWTFGGNEGRNAQMEPGSGTTIMSYAGITGPDTDVQNMVDPYFHGISVQQVTNYIKSRNCQTNTNTGNSIPTVNAGSDYTIPSGTPFVLTGQGDDADGDVITYCWEQFDENNAATTIPNVNATSGVAFRSYNPSTAPERYFPRLETIKIGNTAWKWEAVPNVSRVLNFRLTVRDNKAGNGANESDNMQVNVTSNAGPFVVSLPNTNVTWSAGSSQTVSWDVAGTTGNGINAVNVDILLSTDGGDTYTTTLATAVANDGDHSVIVPNLPGDQNRIMVKGTGNIFFDISNANFTITGSGGPDTEAPSIPENLSASNSTQTSIDLMWEASTDNVGVTGYDIYEDNLIIASIAETSYTVSGLSAGTSYSFRVKAKDAAGNMSDFSNTEEVSTLPEGGGACEDGITSFPYTEGFENGFGDWTQGITNDFDWRTNSGGTPSSNTGPSGASEGTIYAYMESSNPNFSNKRSILASPCFDLSGVPGASFSFQYHMFGASNMGSLALEISTDQGISWTSIWSESGNQGNSWQSESINLSSYIGGAVQLRFNGITGTTWRGDMAIDNVQLKTGGSTGCTDVRLTITFDNYPEDISWEIIDSNNQIIASGGNYGSVPDQSTIFEDVCLEPGSYSFRLLDSFGDGLCCRYGNGSYSLRTAGGTTLASGATFGSSEITDFTINSSLTRNSESITIDNFSTTDRLEVSVNPNPVTNGTPLHISASREINGLVIYDITGKHVLEQGRLQKETINVDNLEMGFYIVKMNVGGRQIIEEFIKR